MKKNPEKKNEKKREKWLLNLCWVQNNTIILMSYFNNLAIEQRRAKKNKKKLEIPLLLSNEQLFQGRVAIIQ